MINKNNMIKNISRYVGKPLSLGDVCLLQHEIKESNLYKPTLKHKYIKFEIEKGQYSFSHNKLIGIYYKKTNEGKIIEIKDHILSPGSTANNPLLEMIKPILNSIAFENLSEFVKDQEQYFK